jgi:hypothetical protein
MSTSLMASPRRWAASLRLADKASLNFSGLRTRVGDPKKKVLGFRQVEDLPRIGVAKPWTCRAIPLETLQG